MELSESSAGGLEAMRGGEATMAGGAAASTAVMSGEAVISGEAASVDESAREGSIELPPSNLTLRRRRPGRGRAGVAPVASHSSMSSTVIDATLSAG